MARVRKAFSQRMSQIPICFRNEQLVWLDDHQEIDINSICRDALDNQIKINEALDETTDE